jgi:hypothetical protein
VQVVLNRARTNEQPRADQGVGQPVAGQSGDQRFLRFEQAEGDRCASARCLAGGRQLAAGPLGEPLCTKPVEKLVGGAQLVAGVDSTVLAAQPLAVHQLGPSQVERDTATAEARNRLLVEGFGARAGGQQGARAGLDPESPVGTTRLCPFDQTLKRHGGELVAAAPHGGFDQFGQRESEQTEPIVSGCQIGCGSGLLIPGEAVEQYRARAVDHAQRQALPPGGRILAGSRDQRNRFSIGAA